MTTTTTSLYIQVVQVTQDFLGPAAERFVSRQITTHIQKEPEELTASDIDKLSEWLKVSVALLTEDEKIVNSYTKSLAQLAKKGK